MRKLFRAFMALVILLTYALSGPFAWAAQESRSGGGLSSIMTTSVGSEATSEPGPKSATVGTDVFLHGNYIEVGVSGSGSFGTANQAPEGFHATEEGYYQLGFVVDNDGWDVGAPPTTGDFFLPGDPEEGFTVGYKVYDENDYYGPMASTLTAYNFTNVERNGVIDIPSVTTDISSGDTLAAKTEGISRSGKLKVEQVVSFGVDDKFFKNTITLTNITTDDTLYDLRYMRSFDPDQDVEIHDDFYTLNAVTENPPANDRALVRAKGATSGEPVFLISFDKRARASSFGFTNRNVYDERAWAENGSELLCDEHEDDAAIVMNAALGNLSPGQSATFTYYTSLNADFEAGLEEIIHNITLEGASVAEQAPEGTLVGTLSTLTTCDGGVHSFVLVDDAGGRFKLEGNNLVVSNGRLLDYGLSTSHSVTVRLVCSATDKTFDKVFNIDVTRSAKALRPIFEGWTFNVADATYSAHWGWKNENSYAVEVPLSEDNKFTGAVLGGTTQPITEFVSGRVYNAFETKFDGSNLVWTLKGPDGLVRTATASAGGPVFDEARYLPLRPVLEGITYSVTENVYTAHWGYKNECSFPVVVPYEHSRFTGSRIPDTAKPINEFVSGRVYDCFNTDFDGTNLVWTLRGPDGKTRTATASKDSKMLVELELDSYAYTLRVNSNHQTVATAQYVFRGENSSEKVTHKAKYTSLNPKIATVSPEGVVTGLCPGKATIKVSYWEVEKEVEVTVDALSSGGSGGSGGSSFTEVAPAVDNLPKGSIIGRMPGYITLAKPERIDTGKNEITLDYDEKLLEKYTDHSARIYYWNDKADKWVALASYPAGGGKIKAINDGNHKGWFTVFGIVQPEFQDISNNWAEKVINRMNGLGLIEGYGPGNSLERLAKPDQNITRAEFAAFLYRLLNINSAEPLVPMPNETETESILSAKFTDCDQIPSWARQGVAGLVDGGIIEGRNNTFCSKVPITRIEAFVMVSKAINQLPKYDKAELDVFVDMADIPDWAQGAVVDNIVSGYPDGTLRPNEDISRAEALTILLRLFADGLGW